MDSTYSMFFLETPFHNETVDGVTVFRFIIKANKTVFLVAKDPS